MKELYKAAEVEIVEFEAEDIVTTSGEVDTDTDYEGPEAPV
jgi:hypothetical protein